MRSSTFELLRIICILLIGLMHISSMAKSIEFGSTNNYIVSFIGSVGNIGVSCFILTSGYFGMKFKKEKFVSIILLSTIYPVVVFLLNSRITADFTLGGLFKSFLSIPLYKNWFIICYLITMLISPFLEIFVTTISRSQYEKLLIILFVVFSLIPTIFNNAYYTVITSGGKCFTYFIFIYILGRFIRLHKNVLFKRSHLLMVFLASTLAINVLNATLEHIFKKPVRIYMMDCSPFILVSSICVFYIFKSMSFHSKIINYISASVLAVFLLDESRLFWDSTIFHINNYGKSPLFIFILLSEVIFFFLVCVIIDKIRILLFRKPEERFSALIIRVSDKLKDKTSFVLAKLF